MGPVAKAMLAMVLAVAAGTTAPAEWVEYSDAVRWGNVELHERARISGAREIAAQMQEQAPKETVPVQDPSAIPPMDTEEVQQWTR